MLLSRGQSRSKGSWGIGEEPKRRIGLAAAGVLAATVDLGVCAQGSSQTDTYVPGCSYIYLRKKAAPAYTYLTSQGAVSWKDGSLAGNALSFPAAGQTWPALTGLYLGSSIVATPKTITGTVDAGGKVELALDYDVLLTVGSSQCRLTGTSQLSSQGTETLGGQATGKSYDPATGAFAVMTTTYGPPAQTGDCLAANTAYDLSQGIGWFLTGTMHLPTAPKPQTASPKLPKKIKPKGTTVLPKKAVLTKAGQPVWTTPTWSTKKSAKGHKAKYASANVTKSGKLTITTTGKAKKLYVKLVLSAPAVPGYQAYSFTKKRTVKR